MTAYEQSPRRIPLWLFVTALLLILANIDPANAYKVPLTELDNLPTTLPYQPVFPSGQSQSRTPRRQLQFPSATIRIPHTMAGAACRVAGHLPAGFHS